MSECTHPLKSVTRATDTNWLLQGESLARYSGPVTYVVVRCESCGWKAHEDDADFPEVARLVNLRDAP